MAEKEKSIWREEVVVGESSTPGTREEIIETDSRKLRNFVQQNSPLNNEMIRNQEMNNMLETDIDGQMRLLPSTPFSVLVKGKTKKTEKEVYTLCSFSYDDNVDLEILNKNGLHKITAYDRRVYNAISTLYLDGRRIVSLSEIFAVMNGYNKSNPSSKQLDAISKSLRKFESVNVFIDFTNEINSHVIVDKQPLIDAGILKDTSDKIKSATIEDRMLHYRGGTLTSEKGQVTKSVQILSEPVLLTYNRAKKTLISVPMEYIGVQSVSATERNIAFQDYLLMRIMNYKKGVMVQNEILYETIYRDSGVERPERAKDRDRDRETINKLLAEWKSKGLIKNYEPHKKGREWYSLTFEADRDGNQGKNIENGGDV